MTPVQAKWLVLAVMAFRVAVARADTARRPSETDDALMERVLGPDAQLAQKVVRSNEIAGGKLVLIGFVNTADNNLVGHLLIEKSPDHFEHASFPSCDEEGGPPELMAVFFARTVKGGGRDLAVLCGWHYGGQANNGAVYAAQFYRIEASGPKVTATSLEGLNKQFLTSDMYESNKRGKWVRTGKPTFTTVAEIKKRLTKMGLPQ